MMNKKVIIGMLEALRVRSLETQASLEFIWRGIENLEDDDLSKVSRQISDNAIPGAVKLEKQLRNIIEELKDLK